MPAISEDEKLRRRNGTESIIGSFAMEGLTLDATTLALTRRFESGELTREQLGIAIENHVAAMLRAERQVVGAA